jgi:uncharacterized surface protein with fasciclin (FAS1) repeats
MNRTLANIILILIIGIVAAITFVALTNDEAADELEDAAGNIQDAGEELGDAAGDLGDAAEITGEEVEEAAEEAGVDDAIDQAGQQVEEAATEVAGEVSEEVEEQSENLATDNVWEVVQSQPDLSAFASMAESTGASEVLADEGEITLFAPTNAAIAAFTSPTGAQAQRNVVLSHIVDDEIVAEDLTNQTLQSHSGGTIRVSKTGNAITLNGNIRVTITDLQATNGVVHVIDAVIQ